MRTAYAFSTFVELVAKVGRPRVFVWYVGEEVHFSPVDHVRDVDGAHRRIAPSLIVEAALLVKIVEIAEIAGAAIDGERAYLEIVVEHARRGERLSAVRR